MTATPRTEVDRNTYDFFEMESGAPTYAYETAVKIDHVLVPYHNIEVKTKFLEQGIVYDDLSEEDKARYEDDFTDEDGEMPDFIPSPAINEFIFNQATVDMVLEDLMTKGIKVAGVENVSELMKPPFDKPQSFIKLFDGSKQKQIVETITRIKENAVKIIS